jgi:hypothetical protein
LDPQSIAGDISKDARNTLLKNIWLKDILPHWDKHKSSSKTKRLIWHGIPSSIRGTVWKRIIGNQLNISSDLFADICTTVNQAEQKNESDLLNSIALINLDLSRTFPDLMVTFCSSDLSLNRSQFFHEDGPLRDPLKGILSAYAFYRPDLGYVQGMSYLAAVLLLNLETTEEAFVAFANILYRDQYFTLYRLDKNIIQRHIQIFEELFKIYLPQVSAKLSQLGIQADMYLFEWIITIFSRSLPLDIASRIWDNFLYFGQIFLFKTALGIIKSYEHLLLSNDSEFEQCLQTLIRPKDVSWIVFGAWFDS